MGRPVVASEPGAAGRSADPGLGGCLRREGLRRPVGAGGWREAAASGGEQCGLPSARGCGDPGDACRSHTRVALTCPRQRGDLCLHCCHQTDSCGV